MTDFLNTYKTQPAKMKSVKVEAPPDAKSPEQMLREIKQEIERRKNL